MHTPAPWHYDPTESDTEIRSRDYWIAKVFDDHIDLTPEIAEANAKLIAAAPELLEACKKAKEALGYLEYLGNYSQAYKMLNKAIKKAEGKP